MRAAEAVNREALDRRKQHIGHLARHLVGEAAGNEVPLQRRHLNVIEVTGHRTPEHVRPAGRHASDPHRDLDDLLLVEDHAQRVLEDWLQQGMRVRDRLPTLLAPDVRMDRVALDRSRPDDRDLDHQVVEALRPGTRKGLHLRA